MKTNAIVKSAGMSHILCFSKCWWFGPPNEVKDSMMAYTNIMSTVVARLSPAHAKETIWDLTFTVLTQKMDTKGYTREVFAESVPDPSRSVKDKLVQALCKIAMSSLFCQMLDAASRDDTYFELLLKSG